MTTYLFRIHDSMKLTFSLAITYSLVSLIACARGEEIFHEDVFLKSNRDGTVTSTFSFTTLLRGQQPRDPSTLREEDTRM